MLRKHFPHRYCNPVISPSAFIASGAQVYGDVQIGDDSSIWFNSVLRGDVNSIRVGVRTNIQDLSLVHVTHNGHPTLIGDDVTIGHSVIVHACTIGHHVLVGMGSTLMDGAEIGDFVIIGAGSLITQGKKIPSGVKVFGRPAKIVAELTEAEREAIRFSSRHYVALSKTYLKK